MDLVPIDTDACRMVARIPNLDTPIRRIFPLHRLLEIIKTGEMALVAPRLWDDPREDPPALAMLDNFPIQPPKQRPLSAYLAPVWAQCWSRSPGSDTLLRAYSCVRKDNTGRNTDRDREGVTVTTTVRRLLAAAEGWHEDGADAHVIVGLVEYLSDEEIGQRVANACNGDQGPRFFCTVQGRAESLLWKRSYFAHEQEVRLLLVDRTYRHLDRPPQLRRVKVDPSSLFT